MFQIIVEFGLFLLIVLIGISQILVPLAQNRKIFPIFRKELSDAEKELVDVGQKVAVDSIVKEKNKMEETLKPASTTTNKTNKEL